MSPRALPGDVENAVWSVAPDTVQPDAPARVPERHGNVFGSETVASGDREGARLDHGYHRPPMTPGPPIGCSSDRPSGFADAAGLAPYLSALGVSHVYLAPVFAARPGSSHGYDVVDPTRLNPELGGEPGSARWRPPFAGMGSGSSSTSSPTTWGSAATAIATWLDVLRMGPREPLRRLVRHRLGARTRASTAGCCCQCSARAYRMALDGRGAGTPARRRAASQSGRTAATGCRCGRAATAVSCAPGAPRILPKRRRRWMARQPMTRAGRRLRPRLARAPRRGLQPRPSAATRRPVVGPARRAHRAQAWRPAKFTLDRDGLNYRRFFAISDLAAVRVEDPDVFAATQALPLALVDEGIADGLRVDHVDGLRDPKAYLRASARGPSAVLATGREDPRARRDVALRLGH